ncbi:MAG: type II secretion system protein [Candidatus Nealsonbacteria bacterium]|nr:type II secretion system protein [Candidatus Nealsonbacteria bacterium]
MEIFRFLNFKKKKKFFFFFWTKKTNFKGFTLIEVLVSLVIIILLTTLVMVNFEWGGYQFALKRSLYKLSQDIRNVQEMAISSRKVEGVSPTGGCGIHFNLLESTSSYILFADTDYNGIYNPLAGDLIIGNEIELEKNVAIYNLSPMVGGALDIVFLPPDPKIKINGTEAIQPQNANIYLSAPTGATGTVSVNSVGLIENDQ